MCADCNILLAFDVWMFPFVCTTNKSNRNSNSRTIKNFIVAIVFWLTCSCCCLSNFKIVSLEIPYINKFTMIFGLYYYNMYLFENYYFVYIHVSVCVFAFVVRLIAVFRIFLSISSNTIFIQPSLLLCIECRGEMKSIVSQSLAVDLLIESIK